MSTITVIDGVRIQTASQGMCLTNGDVWVKEIALGTEANEWEEVSENMMQIIDIPYEDVTSRQQSIPATANMLTPLEFLNRFTEMELAAIYTAAKSVIQIEVWLAKFNRASFIDLNDHLTIEGINGLEMSGLISSGRSAQILAI